MQTIESKMYNERIEFRLNRRRKKCLQNESLCDAAERIVCLCWALPSFISCFFGRKNVPISFSGKAIGLCGFHIVTLECGLTSPELCTHNVRFPFHIRSQHRTPWFDFVVSLMLLQFHIDCYIVCSNPCAAIMQPYYCVFWTAIEINDSVFINKRFLSTHRMHAKRLFLLFIDCVLLTKNAMSSK